MTLGLLTILASMHRLAVVSTNGEAVETFSAAMDAKASLNNWAWLLRWLSGSLAPEVSIGWLGG